MNLFELFVKIGVDDQASGKLKSLSSKLGSGLKTAAKVGTAAVAAVGSGIVALGTYAAKVGGDFEAQMSKVSAISGATGDDLEALEDKAKQLGIDTKFSATEAGQAFEYMAMAGWKTEQMLNGISGIMDLAAASGENLALVSDIVTDAMTAFGLSADQSTHFADVLAQASSNANTNVALLGESFKYVAPVAGSLGYSIEDTATALGLMANAGIKGSQAGTALRAALSSMLDASDPVYTAMIQLGLATEDTVTALVNEDGTTKSLAETMRILRDAFSELTEAEQAEYAANIFGREAMSGMLAIINTSDEEFEKLTNSIYNADGAAKQMAETMANNLQGRLTLLKSSAEGFGLALYDSVEVPLTEMASWAVESLNQLTTAFNENGVEGIVEAAGNILSAAITTVVEKLPEIVELAVSVIESFTGGLLENQETIVDGAISIAMTLVDGIMSFLPNLIELGFSLIQGLSEGISENLDEIVQSGIAIIIQLTSGILNMLPEIIRLGFDLIVSLANGIAESLPELIPTIVDVVLQIVNTLTNPETLANLVDASIAIIMGLANGLITALPMLIDQLPIIIDNIIVAITENLPKIIEMGIELVIKLAAGLIQAIPQLVSKIPQIITSLVNGFASYYSKIFQIGKDLVSKVGEGFKNMLSSAGTWGKDMIDNFIGGIKQKGENLKNTVSSVAQSIKDFLGFSEPKKGPLSNFHTYAPDMMDLFAKGIRDNEDVVTDQIEKSFDFGERTIKFGAEYVSGYSTGADGMAYGSKHGVVNIVQNIYSEAKTAADLMEEALYQQERAVLLGV